MREPVKKVIRFPRIGRPWATAEAGVKKCRQRRERALRHFDADQSDDTIRQDQGLVFRACARINRATFDSNGVDYVDPTARALSQSAAAAMRAKWHALISNAASDAEREASERGLPIFWFAKTVVEPENFLDAHEINAARLQRIARIHRERFAKLDGGVFDIAFVDVSRNQDAAGIVSWSLHTHGLVGITAPTEEDARRRISGIHQLSTDERVSRPLMLKRTYVRDAPGDDKTVEGWLSYMLRSMRISLIMRRESFVNDQGMLVTIDRKLKASQLVDLIKPLSRFSPRRRLILAGVREVRNRLRIARFDPIDPRPRRPPQNRVLADKRRRRLRRLAELKMSETRQLLTVGHGGARLVSCWADAIGRVAQMEKLSRADVEAALKPLQSHGFPIQIATDPSQKPTRNQH